MARTNSNMGISGTQGQLKGKKKTNRSIWPNFEIVRDSMPILVVSKFDQVLIKMKLLVPGTTFSPRESL